MDQTSPGAEGARLLAAKVQQLSDQNLADLDRFKAEGRPVIGFYCLYSPVELAVAAGAAAMPLCGTRNDPIPAAEEILPRNLCPLIKSSFGFAVTGSCPYFQAANLIVGDTTCDGKKKMFEILSRYRTTHVMQLPQHQESSDARKLWRNEVVRLRRCIEDHVGTPLQDEQIRTAIVLLNRERQAKKRLMDVNKRQPAPLSGSQLIDILFKVGFLLDKEKGITCLTEIAEAAASQLFRPTEKRVRRRILLSGVPVGLGSDKVIKIIEQCGGDVVALENCSGYKQVFQVDEKGEVITALADRYLAVPCSVMSPNSGRLELLAELIRGFSIDGVVDLNWQGCHTYNIEAYQTEEFVREQFGLPVLHLETDYAVSDSEQLRVRIEAFLEML